MTDRYWIAVDMDGTLLNSRGQISERTCAVLQKCLDQGAPCPSRYGKGIAASSGKNQKSFGNFVCGSWKRIRCLGLEKDMCII